MKTKFTHFIGVGVSLMAMFYVSSTGRAQSETRIVYSADVTDRKTKQTSHQIFSMDENGGTVVQLTSGGGAFPAWSFDKRYVLFHRATSVENTIYIMEAVGERNGGRTFPVAMNGGSSGVDWSPDARRIVFSGTLGVVDGLWIVAVDADTGEVGAPTLARAGNCAAPVWSPEGSTIAFVGYPGPTIKVLDLATGVESPGFPGYAPSFSPDGARIAFSAPGPVTITNKGKTTTTWYQEIFVANLDGTDWTQVTALADYNNFPKWSAGGSQLAFSNGVNGVYSIYKLTLATGSVAILNRGGRTLDWAP